MIIAVGSQSKIKVTAVKNALCQLGVKADIEAVKAHSAIAEQPFNQETRQGAINRALHTAQLVPRAAFTLAIESGLYWRMDAWLDIALVVARFPDGTCVEVESEAIVFPSSAVEEVQRRGVHTWTAGQVLQEWGQVQSHNDPHLSLVGKSRADFIQDAVVKLFQTLQARHLLSV
ncbi:DUF84 family protein [Tengunoibacter tsumagoiensis]|uniref:inosine/xanthosine triphosphatase n=1 Tax=Tengunoibacter tsumagoiensis TaxID=2014871 RepID=A0A402A834_9CHLR|nr:DUF84 family protein [Tengunoibacter tsumagoiensis]GCE15314.1 hypothetical protein KTT_51730 [Tengunoibacter tsumagoiensis]